MKTRSIGFRLTLWYFSILLASLAVVGGGVWLSLRKSIQHTVDEELHDRLSGVTRFLGEQLRSGPYQDVARELEEQSTFTAGDVLLQIMDSQGSWLYRSDVLREGKVPLAPPDRLAEHSERFDTIRPGPERFRVLSAAVPLEGKTYRVQIGKPLGEFDEVFDHLAWIVLWLAPLVLVLASAGGYWMSRRALAPVDQITQAARSIGIQNLSERLIIPRTGDELQRLSETLNDMMQRLDTAVKRITQFTADASHELRTPIAVMRTTAELALRRERSVPEYREALSQVLAELERTSGLVENLMLLARADSGGELLHKQAIDLAESVREACAQGRMLAQGRDVHFEANVAPQRISVQGDSQALRRVFLILIDNAVKYTASGGSVTVALSATDGVATGEVRDSGIGISREDLPNIFERFYRADKARSREMGGAGLGLSIARWIVEHHHGEIQVESQPGKGSAFRITLPTS